MTEETHIIKIVEYLGLDFAVSSRQGCLICEAIEGFLKKKESIIVDFGEVDILTTAFLNAAIGQLYKEYSLSDLDLLKIKNIKPSQHQLLKKVIDTACHCYSDPKSFSHHAKKHLDHD